MNLAIHIANILLWPAIVVALYMGVRWIADAISLKRQKDRGKKFHE